VFFASRDAIVIDRRDRSDPTRFNRSSPNIADAPRIGSVIRRTERLGGHIGKREVCPPRQRARVLHQKSIRGGSGGNPAPSRRPSSGRLGLDENVPVVIAFPKLSLIIAVIIVQRLRAKLRDRINPRLTESIVYPQANKHVPS
jgi:hypothetical protein